MSMTSPDLELYTESAFKIMNIQFLANVFRANYLLPFDLLLQRTLPLGLHFLNCFFQISTATME